MPGSGRDRDTGGSHEPVHEEAVPLPSERSTGLVFAGVAVLAAVLLRQEPAAAAGALAIAATFAAVALAAPAWLGPLNRGWFRFALALNKVMSPLIMLVLFAGLITPVGLAMQMRRDPLQKRRLAARASYWIPRDAGAPNSSMRDQF